MKQYLNYLILITLNNSKTIYLIALMYKNKIFETIGERVNSYTRQWRDFKGITWVNTPPLDFFNCYIPELNRKLCKYFITAMLSNERSNLKTLISATDTRGLRPPLYSRVKRLWMGLDFVCMKFVGGQVNNFFFLLSSHRDYFATRDAGMSRIPGNKYIIRTITEQPL